MAFDKIFDIDGKYNRMENQLRHEKCVQIQFVAINTDRFLSLSHSISRFRYFFCVNAHIEIADAVFPNAKIVIKISE